MFVLESASIIIRLAHPQDRKEIIRLETLAIANLCQNSYDGSQINQLAPKIPQLYFNDEIIFVAEIDRQIIGFASLLSHRQLLRTLYVKPNFVCHNIDYQLLTAIEQEAIKQNIKTLQVTSSLQEKDFYNSQGYSQVGFCHLGKMDILVPGVAMEKQLTSMSQVYVKIKKIFEFYWSIMPNLLWLFLFF